MSKAFEVHVEKLYDLHVSAFKHSLPNLHKSSPPLKLC